MRIPVQLVIDIPDERLAQYAADWGLPVANPGDRPMARDVVEHVRSKVLAAARHGALGDYAERSGGISFSIKGR
jgi:hypothetical protein